MNNGKSSPRFQDLTPGTLLSLTKENGFSFRTALQHTRWIKAGYGQYLLFLRLERKMGPHAFFSLILNDKIVYSLLDPDNFVSELFKIVQEPYSKKALK